MDYLWFKAIHVVAVLVWIGGVLLNGVVLSLVYREPGSLSAVALQWLRWWDRWISNAAQGVVWIVGIVLIVTAGWFPEGWLLLKLAFVTGIAAVHGTQSATLRKLAAGKDVSKRLPLVRHSAWWVLAAIVPIVVMVILKPF